MKKVVYGFVIFILLISQGCNKPVDVVIPTILQLNNGQSVSDTIICLLSQSVVIDGQTYNPDSIRWQVSNSNNVILFIQTGLSDTMSYAPDDIGLLTITAKVYYNHNKSVTATKQITVTLSTAFLQRKLIGQWTGTAQDYYGTNWTYTINFDSINGHYLAQTTSGNVPCVTWYGQGNDNIPTPLKKLVLNDIGNNGRATGYWFVYYGDNYGNGYATPYDVTEFRFSNNYKQLDFEFFPPSSHYSYTMTRN